MSGISRMKRIAHKILKEEGQLSDRQFEMLMTPFYQQIALQGAAVINAALDRQSDEFLEDLFRRVMTGVLDDMKAAGLLKPTE
jgi:hypothetical protein